MARDHGRGQNSQIGPTTAPPVYPFRNTLPQQDADLNASFCPETESSDESCCTAITYQNLRHCQTVFWKIIQAKKRIK
jgi:hypothetical protein